ncbi:hypothetical protein TNCV_31151 [Trichonephila clavipes]|nr:hypothetical protein TNCV_31151 [Trichonephila clavipes]
MTSSPIATLVSNRSEDLISISVTGQGSNSNDVEMGASINGYTSIDHHSSTTKSDTSEHETLLIARATEEVSDAQFSAVISLDSVEIRVIIEIDLDIMQNGLILL